METKDEATKEVEFVPVRATRAGHDGAGYRQAGDVFSVTREQFDARGETSWFEAVESSAPATSAPAAS